MSRTARVRATRVQASKVGGGAGGVNVTKPQAVVLSLVYVFKPVYPFSRLPVPCAGYIEEMEMPRSGCFFRPAAFTGLRPGRSGGGGPLQ